jgi:[acyl-carrier-protein] S-malonyltransferase
VSNSVSNSVSSPVQSRLLILCPGQGGQHAGMFELARTHAGARTLLDQFDLPSDPALLFANRVAQPLIVAATLAMWEAIRAFTPPPALVAGYSVGELAAHSVAGALAPADAFKLAATRAQLMDQCLQAFPAQALIAISGIRLDCIGKLIDGDGFYIAIETGEDGCIAGGLVATLASVEQKIAAAGGRISRLPVDVASHTRYMLPAVAPFAAALGAVGLQPLTSAVLSGISAVKIENTAMAIDHLSRQIAEKIAWIDCMDACAEAAVTVALELGPGSALSRMLQARHPGIDCRSVADFRSIGGIEKWLARHVH